MDSGSERVIEAIEASRVIPFSGIVNFRDYGDYAVPGGGRVKRGLLYRSAQHRKATPKDLEGVAALDLRAVIDLRGHRERSRAPCPRPEGFAAELLWTEGETSTTLAPHLEAARSVRTVDDVYRTMTSIYDGFIRREHLMELYRRYFARLADGEGATLVHCHAGKDRTGLLVALLHGILGVHPDDMMADYLLTNDAARIEEQAQDRLLDYLPNLDDDALRLILGVHPSFLAAAFAAIEREYGGTDAFLEQGLGVDATRAEAIRQRFIA